MHHSPNLSLSSSPASPLRRLHRGAAQSRASHRRLRAAYDSERTREILPSAVRLGLAFVIAANAAFLLVDLVSQPDVQALLLVIRIVTALASIPIALRAPRNPLLAAVLGCYLTGLMLILVIHFAGGVTGNYSPGLMLLFVGIPVLLPLAPAESALIVGPLQAVFLLSALFESPLPEPHDVVVHAAFPMAAAIECVFSCFVLDRVRFRSFLQRREIEGARDELARLDEAKTRFAANVHHELKTPLTLILGPVESLLEQNPALDTRARTSLESIRRNANRLLAMINSLLDMSRIESQAFSLFRQPVDPNAVVAAIVDSAAPAAEQRRIALRTEFSITPATVDLDVSAFETVVMNLLGNALKFTPSGGSIEIRTSVLQGCWQLEVRDTGVGLEKEDLEKIFDRFAQVDSSDTRPFEGVGIGLSISKEIVDLHNGRIWVESRGKGRGCTFFVRLSASPQGPRSAYWDGGLDRRAVAVRTWLAALELDSRDAVRSDDGRLVDARGGFSRVDPDAVPGSRYQRAPSPIVLIVDDNSEMRRFLVAVLSSEFDVIAAANGIEALNLIEAKRPSAIIADQMMPRMSGSELCGIVKSSRKTAAIPFALLTARSDLESRIAGLEIGADDYLVKPITPRELRARVRSLIRISSLQRELELRNEMLLTSNRSLSASRRGMRVLVRAISHDIRSPVVAAGEALRVFSDDRRRHGLLAIADENIERAEKMIDGLRELIASVGRPVARELVSMRELLVEVIADVAMSRRRSDVAARVSLSATLPDLRCQRAKISLLFFQLLENAFCHADSGQGLAVVLGYSQDAGVHTFRVCDNGPGIGPADADAVFAPFVSGARAAPRDRLGLGLSIAREIAHEHGGRLWLDGAYAEGACFVVELPEVEIGEDGDAGK